MVSRRSRALPLPLAKLRGHAKTIKGLITQAHPGRAELDGVYVDAIVLLTAPDAHLNDPPTRTAKPSSRSRTPRASFRTRPAFRRVSPKTSSPINP